MSRLLTRDEALGWTREHGQRINAGDAAPILYESPFDSPYQLWLRKTGRVPAKEQTPEMQSGNVTEPAIFAWYEQRTGLKGQSQVWMAYEDAEFIQAKADFWHPESRHLAEFKAPTKDDSKDHLLAKEGQVPYHYWLQCQHLMNVFGVEQMAFVSWRAADDHVTVEVPRSDEFWLFTMLPAYMEFQHRVEENAWPKPQGQCEEQSEEWAMHARRRMEAKAMIREAEFRLDRAEAALKRMADNGCKTTRGSGLRASWVEYKPRWEAVIKAENKAGLDAIMKALKPLGNKQGVGEIKPREYPPALFLKFTAENDED